MLILDCSAVHCTARHHLQLHNPHITGPTMICLDILLQCCSPELHTRWDVIQGGTAGLTHVGCS